MLDTALRFAASFLPEGVAIIVGLVLAVSRWKVEPQVAAPALAGLALHLVAVGLLTVVVLVGAQVRTAADLARVNELGGVVGLVVIVLRVLAWTLVLIALFRRLPATGTPRDRTPTGRHALLDAQGEQVVAEEGQTLYPDEADAVEPLGAGAVGAGAVGAGALAAGGLAAGDRGGPADPAPSFAAPLGPAGSPTVQGPTVQGPEPLHGSEMPTEAVPLVRAGPGGPEDGAGEPVVDADADADPDPDADPTEPSDPEDADPEAEPPDSPGLVAEDPAEEAPAEEATDDGAGGAGWFEPATPSGGTPVVVTAGAVEGRPPLPMCTSTPVLRTDFSDDDAWERTRTMIVGPDEVEAPPNLEVIDDPSFADLSTPEVVALATQDRVGDHACLFVVDAVTTTSPESPVLVVALRKEPGREFRCAASEVQAVETRLAISATAFGDFVDAVADDGVFRGF